MRIFWLLALICLPFAAVAQESDKDFLTREYSGQKDFEAKSWKGDPKGRTWTDKLFDTADRPEG